MKQKILLTALMIAMITGAMAQKPTMILTFTADSNAQHVPLNSVLIENLTLGGDTTLYAPDTVLVLDYITGVNENFTYDDNSFSLSQNFPNPMKGKTTVSLWLPERNNILITISDVIGREVANQEFQLEQGSHSFTFYPGRESLYFLTGRADQQSRTIKMFNSPIASTVMKLCKLEYNGRNGDTKDYKAVENLNNFVFDLGDMLKFTSFTDHGERVITSSPTVDQTYYFHYTGDPCPGAPTVTDIDGNVYNTVQIGNQCWMKENLKTTAYNNGTPIPNVTDPDEWEYLTTGAYVWFENHISWKDSYGALYNWFTTVDPNGLCPTGWHVPTNNEWTVLTNYIGGTSSPHGNELKSCRQVNSPLGGGCNTSEHPRWNEHGTLYGTDAYGFSGLPSGFRTDAGTFYPIGYDSYWWSSTAISSLNALGRNLDYSDGYVIVFTYEKPYGYNVRCLRD